MSNSSTMLKISGLYTSFNDLSEAPEGALLEATNIDISQKSVARPRRGFQRYQGAFPTSTHRADRVFFYQSTAMAHTGATVGSADTLLYDNSGTWTSLGSFTAPSSFRMRTIQANRNLFFTTNGGVYKLDSVNGTPRRAGVQRPPNLVNQSSATGNETISENHRVAYRGVAGYRDANDNLILSAPTDRLLYTDSGGGAGSDATIRCYLGGDVSAGHIYQLYRSEEVDALSGDPSPSDELQLVAEVEVTSSDITAGYIDITDEQPEDLRGASLYTNPSQGGIAESNFEPPLAKDLGLFNGRVFYANTVGKQVVELSLLATSSGSDPGIQATHTFTVYAEATAYTYTAVASSPSNGEFVVDTTNGSAGIRNTAQNLVNAINNDTRNPPFGAYYTSQVGDTPGKFLIQETGFGDNAYSIRADDGVSGAVDYWSKAVPVSGDSIQTSNSEFQNGVYWSKRQQPESVPVVNFTEIGSRNFPIKRIQALQNSLFIFKDDGLFRLYASGSGFAVEEFDPTIKILGGNTLATLNNLVFLLTTQGVAQVSETGAEIISLPIEDKLQELFGTALDEIESFATGIGYETDRKYYLALPSTSADDHPTQSYVYNIFTQSWVRHTKSLVSGAEFDTVLYIADSESEYVLQERKNFNYLDYADYGFTTTIGSGYVSGTTVPLTASADLAAVGDILFNASNKFATITAVDSVAGEVTIDTDPGFAASDSVDILKAISTRITWVPMVGGMPGNNKRYHTSVLTLKEDYRGTGYLEFETDLSSGAETVSLAGNDLGLWGLFSWGEAPWGASILRQPRRQWLPRSVHRASHIQVTFRHSYGYSPYQLIGLVMFFDPGQNVSR